ncbi:hypothetical protein CRE_28173 [Caenorhabditis remanei]|uniref:NADH dehydrogenase [ubiquinone] 1 alpha subcomplex subunit 13 n=1 Tax=Caenorhabditis remanei TaxID=31234 RepID=E3LMQ5_CAERE|nr:hypothetical protein CRE_28173 [Caenorhabditis remanei]
MASGAEFRQDMPPKGGYRAFNFHRTFPKLVWSPGTVVAAIFGATAYGVYSALEGKKAVITEKFEDVDINNAMQPFLTAERDRYWLKLMAKNRALEEEIMKDVPGWKTGTWYGEPVYFTLGDKWWDPSATEVSEHKSFKIGENDDTELLVFAHSWGSVEARDHLWRQHSEYAGPKFYDNWFPQWMSKWFW